MLIVRYTAYSFEPPQAISREEFQAVHTDPQRVDALLGGSLGARASAALASHRVPIAVCLVELGLTFATYSLLGSGRTWMMILFFGFVLLSLSSLLPLGATLLSFVKYALTCAWYRRQLTRLIAAATSFEVFMSSAPKRGLLPPVLVGGLR